MSTLRVGTIHETGPGRYALVTYETDTWVGLWPAYPADSAGVCAGMIAGPQFAVWPAWLRHARPAEVGEPVVRWGDAGLVRALRVFTGPLPEGFARLGGGMSTDRFADMLPGLLA